MKAKNLLQIMAIILASISFGICLFLWGQINGFQQGMLAANAPKVVDPAINFVVHGPNFFEVVNSKYLLLAISFYLYLIGRLVSVKELTYLLCFLALGAIFILYWQLFQFKFDIDDSAVLMYRDWLTTSIRFDWLCFTCGVVLLVLQVSSVFLDRQTKVLPK